MRCMLELSHQGKVFFVAKNRESLRCVERSVICIPQYSGVTAEDRRIPFQTVAHFVAVAGSSACQVQSLRSANLEFTASAKCPKTLIIRCLARVRSKYSFKKTLAMDYL
jgi:hypothetical protein